MRSKKRVPCKVCKKPCLRFLAQPFVTCEDCQRQDKRRRAHEQYIDHREEWLARARAWDAAHPERKKEIRRNYERRNFARRRVEKNAQQRRVRAEDRAILDELPCMECGMKHTPERRAAILRRMLPRPATDIREAWPCMWGGMAGERRFYRDIERVTEGRAA